MKDMELHNKIVGTKLAQPDVDRYESMNDGNM